MHLHQSYSGMGTGWRRTPELSLLRHGWGTLGWRRTLEFSELRHGQYRDGGPPGKKGTGVKNNYAV